MSNYCPLFIVDVIRTIKSLASDCLLNHLFRRRSKKTSRLRVTVIVMGTHRWPVDSPHKWPVTRKMLLFDDVIMEPWKKSCIFLNENVCIFIEVLLKFFHWGPVTNKPALVEIIAWCRTSDKPISKDIHYKLWDEITDPFPNYNGAAVEVWQLISNFVSHFTRGIIVHAWI